MSAYFDTSVLIPTLIAELATQAVYDWLGANRELLVGDFAVPNLAISRRLDATLITLDRRLAAAARALDTGVEMPTGS